MSFTIRFNNFAPILALVIILLFSFLMMWGAANEESAIMDELAHIPAGYGYVKYFDYRLNPEHPPLLKALSALPLLGLKLNFPTNHTSWAKDINGQWEMGIQFLYKSGNDPDKIILYSRLAPIFLTLLTIVIIYLGARKIMGKNWGLLPSLLFGLSPTVLAHGHYVTTDLAAAFGTILALFLFLKFLAHRQTKYLILAGLGLGVAELTKFSNALLIPYFLILLLIYSSDKHLGRGYFWHYLRSFFIILLIAYSLVYAVYFLFTLNYPPEKNLADATEILTSFSPRWLAEINLSFIKSSLLRPLGEYLLGLLMVLQRSAGGNTGYFLGEVSAAGWWYYFPLVFVMKEPVPILLLIFISAVLTIKNIFAHFRQPNIFRRAWENFTDYLATHFEEFAMFLFIVIYWSYSIRSPLNIGVRHLLPTFPFIYILTAAGLKRWLQQKFEVPEGIVSKLIALARAVIKKFSKAIALAIILIWFVFETISSFPYFLSYFNQFAGGISNGYRYVTDSNYDWGQDLKRLAEFVKNPSMAEKINKIAVDYFGGGNPKYYLGETVAENWYSSRGNPKNEKIEWLAVSVNTLAGAFGRLHPGQPRKPEDEYGWLREWRSPKPGLGNVPAPDYRAGTSIFIYKL